jgi:hypothetical protein
MLLDQVGRYTLLVCKTQILLKSIIPAIAEAFRKKDFRFACTTATVTRCYLGTGLLPAHLFFHKRMICFGYCEILLQNEFQYLVLLAEGQKWM